MKFIDLSVVVNEDTPVYPGDPTVKIERAGVFAKDGYNDHSLSFGNHVGTHIDAPNHMLDGGKTLDKFSAEQLVGQGRLASGIDIEAVQQAGIKEDDIVLLQTGMADFFGKDEYYKNYPEISEEVANYLVDKKVKMVGMDMASPDHSPFKIHKILLSRDILIIENLTNLAELVGKRFIVYALPINLQLDAAPARVIAELE